LSFQSVASRADTFQENRAMHHKHCVIGLELRTIRPGDSSMDVRYVNAFVRSIRNTFQTMCGLEVAAGKPQLKTNDDPATDVSGVIGFSGDAAGSVVLHFSFDVASKTASAFAGTTIDANHPDFADAIGELANMVAGGAKSQFEGLNISISLPNVIVGKNHNVSVSKSSPRLVVPCRTSVGEFCVEIGMLLGKSPGAVGSSAAVAGAKA
jgi:chemotaxis protein CheX